MPQSVQELCDIEGVGQRHAALLQRAGVDSVSALAAANGTLLRRVLASVNAKEAMVDNLPPESMVVRWVARARGKHLSLTH